MVDKNNAELKNGDRVEILFYSYCEPLCSCKGTIYLDKYINVISGSIPFGDYYTKEITKIEVGLNEQIY